MPIPSATHQALVMWALRKMQADGFVPVAYDGKLSQFDCQRRLQYPPIVSGVRPDVFAFSPSNGVFAFGEAKTVNDIESPHTKQQLLSYARMTGRTCGDQAALYIVVPRSGSRALDRVLEEVGLIAAKQVRRMHVPDCFVEARSNSYA
jgi:hypothetical protein